MGQQFPLTCRREIAAKTATGNETFSRYNTSTAAVDPQTSETTQLLLAWADGDARALDALTPHVYRELRRMAAGFMKGERETQTLQATALVHEVYIRLIDVHNVPWQGK